MNKYQEVRKRHQEEINQFPIKFAFSDKQFEEGMKELGLKPDDYDKVVAIGGGGFVKEEDAERLTKMCVEHAREIRELVEADPTGEGFIKDMFYYELCNHEYGYTYDASEALTALGYTEKQVMADKRLKTGFSIACNAITSSKG